MSTVRAQYSIWGFRIGLDGKFVGSRYATDVNDYKVPSYLTADADVTYDLGEIGWDSSYIKFNVDEHLRPEVLRQRRHVAHVLHADRADGLGLHQLSAAVGGCSAGPSRSRCARPCKVLAPRDERAGPDFRAGLFLLPLDPNCPAALGSHFVRRVLHAPRSPGVLYVA